MYCTNNFESVSVGLIIVFNNVWYHRIDQFIHWPVRGSHQRSNSYCPINIRLRTCIDSLWSHGTASHSTLAISASFNTTHVVPTQILPPTTIFTFLTISKSIAVFLVVNLNSILLWYQTAVWEVIVKYQLNTNSAWNESTILEECRRYRENLNSWIHLNRRFIHLMQCSCHLQSSAPLSCIKMDLHFDKKSRVKKVIL